MFKPAGMLACGLALLAGCSTAPRHPGKNQAEDWHVIPKQEQITLPSPEEPAPQVKPAETAPLLPSPDAPPEMKWLSLNRWREQLGLPEFQRVGPGSPESFALATSNGVLVVTVGSRSAYWQGMEIRLGFAPQMIDRRLFVHALDVRKNFDPLVRPFEAPSKTNRVIVIDPGHGGSNLGARSVADGRLEKDFTLDWARRLVPLLEEQGWRVVLTRVNDTEVSLTNRVTLAIREEADLFLSLHFNSLGADESEPAGLETYCLTPVGMASTLTRGYSDDVSQFFPNNAHDERNFQYAVRLHRALLAVNGNMDRGVRRARFLDVLRGQRCPAVLIEGGYLSNLREARRVSDPAYRQKLAEAVAWALQQ